MGEKVSRNAAHVFSYPNFKDYSQKKHNCEISCYHFSIYDFQRWFKSNIKNISGYEYFTEMMEMEDRSWLKIVQKISCKPWFFD